MDFTKIVKGEVSMKQGLSVNIFKDYMENIPIVKTCELRNTDEAEIELKNGAKITVLLAIAETGYPKQVKDIIAKITHNLYCVIIAPYISTQTANMCKRAKIGYLDLAGNCEISCDSLYIEVKGNKNTNAPKRALKSIYERNSVVSSIILRTMLEDIQRSWKLKELSKAAGCSIGQVSKVKAFLLNQDYIEQNSQGIKITDPIRLMKDWSVVYNNSNEERIQCYSLENIASLEGKIAKMKEEIGIECILTGFSGGSRYQPVVRYQKIHAYIDSKNLKSGIEYLGLKKVTSGANVILMVPYDNCVKLNAKVQKGVMVASPVQLYLDCVNLKGRGEEMAEALLEREICK